MEYQRHLCVTFIVKDPETAVVSLFIKGLIPVSGIPGYNIKKGAKYITSHLPFLNFIFSKSRHDY